MNIKIDSVDDLSLKKTLNMVNVAMHIKSFLMKIIIIITIKCFQKSV